MSDPTRPAKLSNRVYIRRRIAVVAGLLALILVVVMIVAGPATVASWFGAGSPGTATGSDLPAGQKKTEPVPSKEQPESEPQDCTAEQLSVEAVTDATTYGPDDTPQFSLRVTNHGETACNADLGTQTMVFEVLSGAELYWSSADCQVDSEPTLVQIGAGQTLETETIAWERERSSPETCDVDRASVPANGASYHLTVEIGGVKSEKSQQFLLH